MAGARDTEEKMTQNRRTRKKARIAKVAAAGIVFLLLVLFILLFRVRKIQVYGNEYHSAEEISSGLTGNVFMKNTVYMLWKFREGRIPDDMPYLESLHLELKSPSRLDVHVTEKKPVAYLDKDGHVYIDQEGTVLEITDQTHAGVPIVTGMALEEPLLYQKLPAASGAQLRTTLSLAQLLAYQGVSVDEIRFGENMDITIFTGSIEIQLGQDEYLEEKIANLAKILPRLEGESGTLHLEGFTGRNEQVPFTPSGTGVGAEDEEDGGDSGGEEGDSGDGDTQEDGGNVDGEEDAGDGQEDGEDEETSGTVIPMVFNSSGTLVYNVHVENGTVVDEYGNPVPGVTVNENGYVVDAYMNMFDPATGENIQQ